MSIQATVVEVLNNDLNLFIKNNPGHDYLVIDFYAEWCGPCQKLAPILSNLKHSDKKILVLKIDIDKNSQLSDDFEITSIPTLVFQKLGDVQEFDKSKAKTMQGIDQEQEILDMLKLCK